MPLARCGGKFEVSSCCKWLDNMLDKLRSVKRFTYEMFGLLATAPLGLSFLAPTTHRQCAVQQHGARHPSQRRAVRMGVLDTIKEAGTGALANLKQDATATESDATSACLGPARSPRCLVEAAPTHPTHPPLLRRLFRRGRELEAGASIHEAC